METNAGQILIMMPQQEWREMQKNQQLILELLKQLMMAKPQQTEAIQDYLTVKQFMAAVKIGRTKFNSLLANNQIRSVRKSRKIYIPVREVERYFKDPTVY